MAKITDKDYYLDDTLISNLDFCIKRQKKNFDHVFIIDGKEGYGKSTFSFAVGYYLAWKTNKAFTVDNVFFDAESMARFASDTEEQVIIWDEAALAGLSTEWQNKVQKKLVKLMMVARKKRHFWVFNIPQFFRLNEYIAVDRAMALLHVYSSDNISRGQFVFMGNTKKNGAYDKYRRTRRKSYAKFDFAGRFTNTTHLLDIEEYDKRKDTAIESIFKDSDEDRGKSKLLRLQFRVTRLERYSKEELAAELGVNRKTIFNWSNLPSKYPDLLGISD